METTKINDYEEIVYRLNHDYVAYIYIDNKINSPLLQVGDKVALKRKDYYDIKDIILYEVDGNYYIRRIISKSEKTFFVCGDSEFEIRIIEDSAIIAKVLERQRGIKRYSLTLNRNDTYVNALMKKAKLLIKKHTIYDDKTATNNVYEQATNASYINNVERKSKLKNKEIVSIDLKLEKELADFKSIEQKIAEYEENFKRLQTKNKFQKQSN